MSESNLGSPDEAVAAHAELIQKGRYKAIVALVKSARKEESETIVDCVTEDAIDLVSTVLHGLGVDTAYHLNHPSSNELIAMLTSLTEVALIRSGQYVNGDPFDRSVVSEAKGSDAFVEMMKIELPSLHGLTALPEESPLPELSTK